MRFLPLTYQPAAPELVTAQPTSSGAGTATPPRVGGQTCLPEGPRSSGRGAPIHILAPVGRPGSHTCSDSASEADSALCSTGSAFVSSATGSAAFVSSATGSASSTISGLGAHGAQPSVLGGSTSYDDVVVIVVAVVVVVVTVVVAVVAIVVAVTIVVAPRPTPSWGGVHASKLAPPTWRYPDVLAKLVARLLVHVLLVGGPLVHLQRRDRCLGGPQLGRVPHVTQLALDVVLKEGAALREAPPPLGMQGA